MSIRGLKPSPYRVFLHECCRYPVQHVVGPIRLRRDLGVEADQRFPHVILDEGLVRLPRQALRPEVVPTETGQRAIPPREAGSGSAAAKDVTESHD